LKYLDTVQHNFCVCYVLCFGYILRPMDLSFRILMITDFSTEAKKCTNFFLKILFFILKISHVIFSHVRPQETSIRESNKVIQHKTKLVTFARS
jgi:hypothetical protein